MKIDLNKTSVKLGTVVGILAIFGISFTAVLRNTGDVWRLPPRHDSLLLAFEMFKETTNAHIARIYKKIHLIDDVQEMDFYFGRSMTDPYNDKMYEIQVNDEVYKVEIRRNNEGKLFGFVYDMNIKYTLYRDTDGAEIRYYVMIHDIDEDGNQNTYLEEED